MYQYEAKLVKVVDGDTVHLEIDLGLDTYRRIKCRLHGVNAPELNTDAGKLAKAFLSSQLGEPGFHKLIVHTFKDRTEKYGRYLVDIRFSFDSPTVNQMLLETGHATPYLP